MKAILFLTSILLISFGAHAVETMGQKTGETIDGAVASAQQKKNEARDELQKSYEDVSKKIADLKTNVTESTGQAQKDMNTQIKSLEQDQKRVSRKIEKMKTATGSAWEELKKGASTALDNMKKAVDSAEDKFK